MGMQKTIRIDVGSSTPLWPYEVVQVIEDVMQEGERKGKHGWESMPVTEHLERAHDHLAEARESRDLDIPKSEDHLAHAFTRLMMAIAIERGYVQKGGD